MRLNGKKVVVFGGSGFLGSHISDALTKLDADVIIFDKVQSPYLITNQQKMVVGDILDEDLVCKTVQDADYVFHFAAVADIAEASQHPIKTIKYNILGTANILNACTKSNVSRFLFGSTVYVYSKHGSFYRSSKQSAELIIENYAEDYGLRYTILRYGSLYGSRANNFNFVRNIIIQAIKNKKIIRHGNGSEFRDYIHIDDAATATIQTLDKTFINSHVMITGDRLIRVRDLLNMVKEIFDNNIEIIYDNSSWPHHYDFTPFTFRPKVAKKIQLSVSHDLGQGIHDLIHEVYENIGVEKR